MKQLMSILKNAGYLGIGTLVLAGEGVVYTVAKGKVAFKSYQDTIHECSESEYTDDTPNYPKPDDKHVNEEELLDMLDDKEGYKSKAEYNDHFNESGYQHD
jgi:hypothetical protein